MDKWLVADLSRRLTAANGRFAALTAQRSLNPAETAEAADLARQSHDLSHELLALFQAEA